MAKAAARQGKLFDGPAAEPRFTMLETIREYGLESLGLTGELPATKRRHAAYFLALAEQAEPELRGPHQVAWAARLEEELENANARRGSSR